MSEESAKAAIKQTDEESPSRPVFSVVTGSLVLLLLYVLSAGPVAALIDRSSSPQAEALAEAVYAPLIWLHDNTFLETPLDAYIELWVE